MAKRKDRLKRRYGGMVAKGLVATAIATMPALVETPWDQTVNAVWIDPEIEPQYMDSGGSAFINLNDYFSYATEYDFSLSEGASAFISAYLSSGGLQMNSINSATGTATVTVTAYYQYGGSDSDTFYVRVGEAGVNNAPIWRTTDLRLTEAIEGYFYLPDYAYDFDEDSMTYPYMEVGDLDKATASLDGENLHITAYEDTTVTMAVYDGITEPVYGTFNIIVEENTPPFVDMPVEDFHIVEGGTVREEISYLFDDYDYDDNLVSVISDDESVLEVDLYQPSSGVSYMDLTAVGLGHATLTVTAQDLAENVVTETIEVLVTPTGFVKSPLLAADDVLELSVYGYANQMVAYLFPVDADTTNLSYLDLASTALNYSYQEGSTLYLYVDSPPGAYKVLLVDSAAQEIIAESQIKKLSEGSIMDIFDYIENPLNGEEALVSAWGNEGYNVRVQWLLRGAISPMVNEINGY